ncbi:unnamed protein product [Cylicostephanus goldi]|uniref:Chitin-binding type-2 domain-containing protein n=1 Tax=Cylicostephanus goldi TaxID=71465 RepID=A0A3P6QQM7_CYLGO|nr:unnamed protein product [Cylicostephanus goldi]
MMVLTLAKEGILAYMLRHGCSSRVTACTSLGKEMSFMCPFDLIFDESLEECVDYRVSANCSTDEKQSRNGTKLQTLAGGQVYDESQSLCVGPGELDACNLATSGTETTTASSEESSGAEPILGNGTTIDCGELAGGFYDIAKCSPYYLNCPGNLARVAKCSDKLVYARNISGCVEPTYVDECNEQLEASADCKEDGFFSYGNCSDQFYG